jgi:hypothetical protein
MIRFNGKEDATTCELRKREEFWEGEEKVGDAVAHFAQQRYDS